MFKDAFDPEEIARFNFIEEQHPANLVLHPGNLQGEPVSVIMWMDEDTQVLRPLAIILSDGLMESLQLQGGELEKDV